MGEQAWDAFKSKDAGFGEKAAALAVAGAMKVKRKIGAGCAFKEAVRAAKIALAKSKVGGDLNSLSKTALVGAKNASTKIKTRKRVVNKSKKRTKRKTKKKVVKKKKKKKKKVNKKKTSSTMMSKVPRIIPIPKSGGALPLIPILAALSAFGA